VEKALPLLNQVREQRPNSAEASHFIGRAYLKQGGLESAAAMRYLQRAVELDPNKPEYHLYVAWAANDSTPAQLGLARTHVDRALTLDRLLADGYWQRGVVSLREGAINDAMKDLKYALELKPSRHEAHATLAECYEQKNDIPAAMSEWAKAIAGDDKQPMWRYHYGRMLLDRGNAGEAARHLAFAVDAAKKAQPRPGWLAKAAFEAGEAERKTGQKAQAIEAYNLFLELCPPSDPDRRDALRALKELGAPYER
jgi:tetratricopeptide (TPR) repeat protein